MPTKHDRIAVVNDPPLQAALERVATHVGGENRPARLVHDLAIRGADALIAERERRQAAIAQLLAWTGDDEPPWDPDTLGRVRGLAWREPGEA